MNIMTTVTSLAATALGAIKVLSFKEAAVVGITIGVSIYVGYVMIHNLKAKFARFKMHVAETETEKNLDVNMADQREYAAYQKSRTLNKQIRRNPSHLYGDEYEALSNRRMAREYEYLQSSIGSSRNAAKFGIDPRAFENLDAPIKKRTLQQFEEFKRQAERRDPAFVRGQRKMGIAGGLAECLTDQDYFRPI